MGKAAGLAIVLGFCAYAQADEIIDLVSIMNPGNAPDPQGMYAFGAVASVFSIGKFEVTTGQYTAFLNAVAKTDTYGLYSTSMNTAINSYGCNIRRSGSSGSYTYTVGTGSPTDVANWASRPVNFVSWGDAARFANWLYNGQPTGAQGPQTTEDGSYLLNGATSDTALLAVLRKPSATWVIPTEDEWYKAAYYDPNKPGGAGYWDYPTRTNTAPSNVYSPTGTNNANFYNQYSYTYTIGAPYWRTNVGAFTGSPGPYGTYDQGGNVWEWNETKVYQSGAGWSRGGRGGGYDMPVLSLDASSRTFDYPSSQMSSTGFRVALIPEPGTLALLLFGGLAVVRRPR